MLKGRTLKNNKGQTLVEFALVLFLLLAILFGIVEFGRLWFYSNHLNNSVRAAARYGAVLGSGFSTSAIDTYLRKEIGSFMPADDIDKNTGVVVTVYDGATANTKSASAIVRGDTVKVTVTYNFRVLSGSIIPFFKGDYTIVRTASMRFE